MQTIRDLIAAGRDGDTALEAPGREPLAYRDLRRLVERAGCALRDAGIARTGVVALVLPNGPEAATAFLAAATVAIAAPLNPRYRDEEFDFYLRDLGASALIVLKGYENPVREVAKRLEIPVLEIEVGDSMPAGWFEIPCGTQDRDVVNAVPDDTALVLHTSGTTARPKIVPLTQRNLTVSATAVAESLLLHPGDRCLNVMPLFHIHGLVAALLASLATGARVICTPGFNALRFMDWVTETGPTWYTAVPTMHQAIVSRATRRPDEARRAGLRLIRSSSAALAGPVLAALEEVFDAPVVEAYGMTEAAHQITSNPLPPSPRKPGTVGKAAGPAVGIMDMDGNLLPSGETGEIVVRGAGITAGYAGNPDANRTSFTNGWFRTGDQGWIDMDGYLTITGRIKEIINRGGEKVSPREVEEILLSCPGVAEAVTFAVKHEKLGEDVAAAVVAREECVLESADVRHHAAKYLADFKVPRQVLILDDIPKGATGKVQRIGLARKLGLEADGQ